MNKAKFRTILAVTMCWNVAISGQNLAPNPGFESFIACPTNTSQFTGYSTSWSAANTASPDLAGCGWTGTSQITVLPQSGNGAAGIWGGANHFNCPGLAYAENITASLATAMTPGQVYSVSFAVQVDAVGSLTAAPNGCVDFGLYFYSSAAPPVVNGYCCMAVSPQYFVNGSAVPRGSYALFSGNVTATAAWDRIQVGAFCNGNTSGAACSNFTGNRMYFNFDNLVVQPVSALAPKISAWKVEENEREIAATATGDLKAGDRLEVIHWTQAAEMKSEAISFMDYPQDEIRFSLSKPGQGNHFYQLRVTDQEGNDYYSLPAEIRIAEEVPLSIIVDNGFFNLSGMGAGDPWTFTLSDVAGKIIERHEGTGNGAIQRIEMVDSPAGVMVAVLHSGGKTEVKRILFGLHFAE